MRWEVDGGLVPILAAQPCLAGLGWAVEGAKEKPEPPPRSALAPWAWAEKRLGLQGRWRRTGLQGDD